MRDKVEFMIGRYIHAPSIRTPCSAEKTHGMACHLRLAALARWRTCVFHSRADY